MEYHVILSETQHSLLCLCSLLNGGGRVRSGGALGTWALDFSVFSMSEFSSPIHSWTTTPLFPLHHLPQSLNKIVFERLEWPVPCASFFLGAVMYCFNGWSSVSMGDFTGSGLWDRLSALYWTWPVKFPSYRKITDSFTLLISHR